ncbi:MAG: hypothetical protein IJ409_04885 [Lachnospiraceae bacterium]|nr:hypothetical protein [Lachnospiraceae bacterium]
MRIDSSTIGMESARTYSSVSSKIKKITITNGRQSLSDGTDALFGNLLGTDVEGNSQTDKQTKESESTGTQSLGNFIQNTMEEMRAKVQAVRTNSIVEVDLEEAKRHLNEIRQQCLNYLMELFFPERSGNDFWKSSETAGSEELSAEQTSGSDVYAAFQSAAGSANITTFQYSSQYYYEETENTSFTTQGTVRCADGREINFNLNVEMSRSFQQYYEENVTIAQVNLCDPLVINLEGNIAELSDQTFYFDIDADGVEDEISRLTAASGFLALDKDENGVINDGSELFGAKSGDGFGDLAAFDEDGNGFIDEGDSIWNKLKIWIMDENGEQQLYSLAEKGVGAICLMNANTDFTLTGENNGTNGVIRKTGFFLFEDGNAGTVQHVDLAKHDREQTARQALAGQRYDQAIYGAAV